MQNVRNVFNRDSVSGQAASLIEIVQEYVQLRRVGREYVGLCPFHREKTPSFFVNEEKGLFFCQSCHVGGDIFTFIEKIEGVDFKTAAKRLGRQTYRPSIEQIDRRNRAKRIVSWARETSRVLSDSLREIGDRIRICSMARKEPGVDREFIALEEASLIRQWAILCDLDDDLNDPKMVLELWEQRGLINNFLESLV